MGREHTGAGQYIFLCFACLIFFVFSGCATLKEMNTRRSAQVHLQRSEELLAQGDYENALLENKEVLSMAGKTIPGDKALFNMGLIYAHYENPEKDYTRSREFFDRLIAGYPRSSLVEQAKMWVDTLGCLEKEKQSTVELEKKIEELETQTKQKESEDLNQNGQSYFTRSQKLLEQKQYGKVLKEARTILSKDGKANKDKALFNKGLVYAHNGYSEKDYKEASSSFKELIDDYPRSPLAEQAKIWVSILDVIQVDIDIEEKKKKLEEDVDIAIEEKKKELEDQVDSVVEEKKKELEEQAGSAIEPEAESLETQEDGLPVRFKDGGGNLVSLAEKHYGTSDPTVCDFIRKANPDITDVRKIDDNKIIFLPVITAGSYVEEQPDGGYRIHLRTFYTSESANAHVKRVNGPDVAIDIDEVTDIDEVAWYRVMMKGFKSRKDALNKADQLKEKNLISFPLYPSCLP